MRSERHPQQERMALVHLRKYSKALTGNLKLLINGITDCSG